MPRTAISVSVACAVAMTMQVGSQASAQDNTTAEISAVNTYRICTYGVGAALVRAGREPEPAAEAAFVVCAEERAAAVDELASSIRQRAIERQVADTEGVVRQLVVVEMRALDDGVHDFLEEEAPRIRAQSQ